jgi:hypothetical protein
VAYTTAEAVLGDQLSASLREILIEQMAAINSAHKAAAWAHRNMPAKNTQTAADAKTVKERFQERLSSISNGLDPNESSDSRSPPQPPRVAAQGRSDAIAEETGTGDPSQKGSTRAKKQSRQDIVRSLGKTGRRDKDHRKFVLRQACLVCGRVPSDPITSPLPNPAPSDAE